MILTFPHEIGFDDPIRERTEAFFVKARMGTDDELLALLKEGICIEAHELDGYTPLHYAAEQRKIGTVHALIHSAIRRCYVLPALTKMKPLWRCLKPGRI